jgi:hypothetical protein
MVLGIGCLVNFRVDMLVSRLGVVGEFLYGRAFLYFPLFVLF